MSVSPESFADGMATYDSQVVLYPLADFSSSSIDEIDATIASNPNDPELYMKKGIALSRESFRHQQAVDTFSQGLQLDPFHALLYRHRGHRYINLREFNPARADLELSSRLDPSNWDTWYHLGLGHYLVGDFARAETAYRQCWALTHTDDNRVAIADWLYMTLMRLNRPDEAIAVLDFVTPETDPGENGAYFRRLLMYKGIGSADELLADADKASLDFVTLGYGLGNYFFCSGNTERAIEVWSDVLAGSYWSAFGYIAAEVDLRRLGRTRR